MSILLDGTVDDTCTGTGFASVPLPASVTVNVTDSSSFTRRARSSSSKRSISTHSTHGGSYSPSISQSSVKPLAHSGKSRVAKLCDGLIRTLIATRDLAFALILLSPRPETSKSTSSDSKEAIMAYGRRKGKGKKPKG